MMYILPVASWVIVGIISMLFFHVVTQHLEEKDWRVIRGIDIFSYSLVGFVIGWIGLVFIFVSSFAWLIIRLKEIKPVKAFMKREFRIGKKPE